MKIKIGVLSDTHLHRVTEDLRAIYDLYLVDVDIILHAGDFVSSDIVAFFDGDHFHGVCGNMDTAEIRSRLPEKQVLEIEGKRLGLIHGWGGPWGIQTKIQERFEAVDAIIYGHTHAVQNEIIDGILFFNPGSATGRLPAMSKSYGVIVVNESIRGEIIVVE